MAGIFKLGLTGGIGSGKSTVAQLLAEYGATVVDADAVSRNLTASGGAAMPAIAEAFGPHMLAADGSLNRAAMRNLVFEHPHERQRLEAILHPLVQTTLAAQIAKPNTRGPRSWCSIFLCWSNRHIGARRWMPFWSSIAVKPPKLPV